MIRMTQDILDDLFRDAALAQDRRTVLRMLFKSRVDLPIEIMKQADQSPCPHIFAELLSVEAHGGLDGKHVADKSFIFYKFTSKGKSFSAGHNYLYFVTLRECSDRHLHPVRAASPPGRDDLAQVQVRVSYLQMGDPSVA